MSNQGGNYTDYPQPTYDQPQGYSQSHGQSQGYPQSHGQPQAQGYPQSHGHSQQYGSYVPPQNNGTHPGHYTAPGYSVSPNTQQYVLPLYKKIMEEQLISSICLDCGSTIISCFCFPCVMGMNISAVSSMPCVIGCILSPFCCGCFRSTIQTTLGVMDSGCCVNTLVHYFCPICAVVQERRAIGAYISAQARENVPSHVIMG